ncbi:acyl-CoA desaturase [Leptospira kmetyi]|uniref:acyl-CoA desaturase n=1 Tax=Leptospira kmetyi TaxID=408139 RepID=UPI003EBDCE53
MVPILILFFAHWFGSVFAQTFFLHRYAAHAMFSMNRRWEKFFHLLTMLLQGPSYLNPYGYAVLHRMHHSYSDTEEDPHSPHFSKNAFDMMIKTKKIYDDFAYDRVPANPEFTRDFIPRWKSIDMLGQNWWFRIGFGSLYAFYYMAFVPEGQWAWYLLLPIHWLMGPIHGAIVNWGGHKYGYRNHFKTQDESKNMLPIDFLTMGELYQNNHHGHPTSPNFAYKWWEVDFCFQIMKGLHKVGIINIKREVWTTKGRVPVSKAA